MNTVKLSQLGKTQTVCLPEAFCLPGEEVKIHREGSKIILEPLVTSWDELLRALDEFSGDFLDSDRSNLSQSRHRRN
jgi:virulence-associated protein VagC